MDTKPEMANRSSYSAMENGRCDYEPSYAFSPVWQFGAGLHCHDFYEIYIHLQGAKYYCIDESVYPIKPNQLMIVPPFTMHGHIGAHTPVNYERAFLYVTPAFLKSIGANMMDLDGFLRNCGSRRQYQYLLTSEEAQCCTSLLREMKASLDDNSPMGRLTNYSKMLSFLQIVCHTVQRSGSETMPVVVNEPMQEVLS